MLARNEITTLRLPNQPRNQSQTEISQKEISGILNSHNQLPENFYDRKAKILCKKISRLLGWEYDFVIQNYYSGILDIIKTKNYQEKTQKITQLQVSFMSHFVSNCESRQTGCFQRTKLYAEDFRNILES
ncbi:hypothetical protein [Candidatus Absconditicoccus praedator]|uniref:hypothetical protein n=1 Tax=Candidatus Absconditicoccus praedator TaxID=2735562 RepID=UPI001E32969E|nr:hypothetical protein [Candidatus Absconditicoccus praedator]UFX83433.1 hypothetical protein HLG78_04870 [Candidatus Absconditicoccus praedator]